MPCLRQLCPGCAKCAPQGAVPAGHRVTKPQRKIEIRSVVSAQIVIPRDRDQTAWHRRFSVHNNVQLLGQVDDRINLTVRQKLAALKLPECIRKLQWPDGGRVQPLVACLPPDAIGIIARLIARKPSNHDAGIDDDRHYSLPSSISLCRLTLRRVRQVLLNSTIRSITPERSHLSSRAGFSGTTRATTFPRLVITVCFPLSARLTTSENRAFASNTLSLSIYTSPD